jgi:hypothetical protein
LALPIELVASHRDILRSPVGLWGSVIVVGAIERRVLGPRIETLGIIPTLLASLDPFAYARLLLARDRASTGDPGRILIV